MISKRTSRCEACGGVHGGPDDPIYPPCADKDLECLLDFDSLLADLEDEDLV